MTIAFTCPHCDKQYRVKDELRGRTVSCKDCEHRITIGANEDVFDDFVDNVLSEESSDHAAHIDDTRNRLPRRQSLGVAPKFTLHPVKGVVWAAFWGTPIAAGIVMAINYARIGKTVAAFSILGGAVVGAAALFGVIVAIPAASNIPDLLFTVPQLIAVYAIASALQGELILNHSAQGGTVASAWPSVGIGILCLPFVLGAMAFVVILLAP